MADRDAIVRYANELLEIERWPEFAPAGPPGDRRPRGHDAGVRGLQLARAVRGCVKAGAEMVLVHHGLFWRNEPLVVDARLARQARGAVPRERLAARLPPRTRRAPRARQQRTAGRAPRRFRHGPVRQRRAWLLAAAPVARCPGRHGRAGNRAAAVRDPRRPGGDPPPCSSDAAAAGYDLIRAAHEGFDALRDGRAGGAEPARGCGARNPPDRGRPSCDGAIRRAGAGRPSRRALRPLVALRRDSQSGLATTRRRIAHVRSAEYPRRAMNLLGRRAR